MDPVTLTEVSIVGPRGASQQELQKTAIQKLRYVMEKEQSEREEAPNGASSKGRGIVV